MQRLGNKVRIWTLEAWQLIWCFKNTQRSWMQKHGHMASYRRHSPSQSSFLSHRGIKGSRDLHCFQLALWMEPCNEDLQKSRTGSSLLWKAIWSLVLPRGFSRLTEEWENPSNRPTDIALTFWLPVAHLQFPLARHEPPSPRTLNMTDFNRRGENAGIS